MQSTVVTPSISDAREQSISGYIRAAQELYQSFNVPRESGISDYDQETLLITATGFSSLVRSEELHRTHGKVVASVLDLGSSQATICFADGLTLERPAIVVGRERNLSWSTMFFPESIEQINLRIDSTASLAFARPLLNAFLAPAVSAMWHDKVTYPSPESAYPCTLASLTCSALARLLGPEYMAIECTALSEPNERLWCITKLCNAEDRHLVQDELSTIQYIHDLIWNNRQEIDQAIPQPLSSICIFAREQGLRCVRTENRSALILSNGDIALGRYPLGLVLESDVLLPNGKYGVSSSFLHHHPDWSYLSS